MHTDSCVAIEASSYPTHGQFVPSAHRLGRRIGLLSDRSNVRPCKDIDRGGLVYPEMAAVNAVTHNYVVVEELSKRAEFLNVPNQRQLVTDLTSELLNDDDSSDFDDCEQGHKSEVDLKHVM
ncbi:hypothetical protein HPB48_017654 [Haemaphysalis longicornis]|uniref:Uncharacterized protein n=1 Tax=Haemaphysalis longicornis TaxID=44386 RepID=A0A9J6GYJ2_HAELO|nr:hypothetical protein HPB48_017654 [Haemaphysalis longicornis]